MGRMQLTRAVPGSVRVCYCELYVLGWCKGCVGVGWEGRRWHTSNITAAAATSIPSASSSASAGPIPISRQSMYEDSHYKDKTVSWPSYLYNGNPHTGKMASLYWSIPGLLPRPPVPGEYSYLVSPAQLQSLDKWQSSQSGPTLVCPPPYKRACPAGMLLCPIRLWIDLDCPIAFLPCLLAQMCPSRWWHNGIHENPYLLYKLWKEYWQSVICWEYQSEHVWECQWIYYSMAYYSVIFLRVQEVKKCCL